MLQGRGEGGSHVDHFAFSYPHTRRREGGERGGGYRDRERVTRRGCLLSSCVAPPVIVVKRQHGRWRHILGIQPRVGCPRCFYAVTSAIRRHRDPHVHAGMADVGSTSPSVLRHSALHRPPRTGPAFQFEKGPALNPSPKSPSRFLVHIFKLHDPTVL